MRIYIGADHAGYNAKRSLTKELTSNGHDVIDCGGEGEPGDDYVDYAKKVGKLVAKNSKTKGILLCGSGTGMMIAANKVKGVRAAHCYDTYSAKKSREDNDANVLTLRTRGVTRSTLQKITSAWLSTAFSNKARHKRRIAKLE